MFLDTKNIKLEKKGNNRIDIIYPDGKVFEKVHFILLFPFTDRENFISVVIKKGLSFKEIGIIRSLKDLPLNYQNIIKESIRIRYFIPEIKDIKTIIKKNELYEIFAITDRGEKVFQLRNVRESLKIKNDGSIIITDIERCRYRISHYDRLPAKAKIELDKILL